MVQQDSLQIEQGQTAARAISTAAPHRYTHIKMEPLKADTGYVEHTEPQLVGAPAVRPADPKAGLFNSDSTMVRGLFGKALLHSDFDDSLRAHTEIAPYHDQGIAGDPIPYRFRTDNYVTIALLLDFFLGVLVIARSRRYLANSIKHFFRPYDHRNMFTERTDTELHGQLFLILQTCFILGVLTFDFVQNRLPEVFNIVSPYTILLASSGIFAAFYLMKIILYYLINNVFFDHDVISTWRKTYLLSVFSLGIAFFPLALLVVYFDLSFSALPTIVLVLLSINKLMLTYKAFHIFSGYKMSGIHIILYLCTLEILPLFALWRALVYSLNSLTAIE